MDRLLAQDAIQRLMVAFNHSQDQLDRSLLESCFLPNQKFTLDLSQHLPQIPTRQLTAEDYWQESLTTIPGFTATHHQLGPLYFEFRDDNRKATASATITATYSLQTEEIGVKAVVVKGLQIVDAELADNRWVIRGFKIVRDVPLENVELFGLAGERVKKGIHRPLKN